MMKAINRLELASIENNKRFHNDFKKLHEEITVITKPVHSTSTETHQ